MVIHLLNLEIVIIFQHQPLLYFWNRFPLFRLADAYLMFAECVVRGASGGTINQLQLIMLMQLELEQMHQQ